MQTLSTARWATTAGLAMLLFASGCQSWPMFDHYANAVDDVSDTHLYFDHLYNPKIDATRMGKPDWYTRWNAFLFPRIAINGSYDRYDKCNLYPPLTPYEFPTNVMPPPTVRTTRPPKPTDPDAMPDVGPNAPLPSPGGVSSPNDDQ